MSHSVQYGDAINQSSPALTVSMDVPHTQNTAPVLEYRCMYTSDLRRKQKRWQDGRLKFHTFNKRVMVYDERSNFVGDTHWRKDYDFDDGEELELERGGILVEVGECIGKKDQDLTELVDKRVKDREERAAAKNTATPMRPHASLNQQQTPARSALLRPKSLNAVLGNPTGHYGKAVIKHLSPFELRQQANRDENENERPTKRRKQDDTPPSKSGYAQSLMGTRLSLASSRPPSTTTIRYEPLRHNIQRTPAVSIDLTINQDDHSRPGKVRPDTNRGDRQAKPLRQRPHKSPLARSGYASNLTGASLSLNMPESFALKRYVSALEVTTKGTRSVERTGSSSSVEPDSLMENDSSEERPTKRSQKPKELAKKKTKPQQPDPMVPSRSSSPPVMSRPITVSKSTSTLKDKVTQDAPGGRLMADKPLSTLRIKSRAPRKMMMLMERPISRSPAPTESSDDIKVARKQQIPKDPVLSQATMRLDAFREQQERRLQERLNAKRPDTHVDESLSSPADSGIDHRMIDNLLSRRTKPPEKGPSALPVEASKPSAGSNSERSNENEHVSHSRKPDSPANKVVAPISVKNSNLEHPITHFSPPNNKRSPQPHPPVILKALPKPTIPSTDATSSIVASTSGAQNLRQPTPPSNPKVLQQSAIPSTDAVSTMAPSPSDLPFSEKCLEPAAGKVISNESSRKERLDLLPGTVNGSDEPLERNEPKKVAPVQVAEFSQSAIISPKSGIPDTASESTSPQSQPPTANKSSPPTADDLNAPLKSDYATNRLQNILPQEPRIESNIPRVSPTPRPKMASLPAHFSSVIMSATDHFRSIIKYSPSPTNQVVQQSPLDLEHPTVPPALLLEAQEEDVMSSEVVIKASPKPSPAMEETLGVETQRDEAAKSGARMENTMDAIIPTVPDAKIGQRKAKLINPATRGLSVQMTASKTVNALVPAFNPLPSMPTPLRTLARPGRTPAQDEFLANGAKEPVKEVTPGGPWSRESFDLFGLLKLPGRATGSGIVNG